MGSSRATSPPARGLSRHLCGRHACGRKVPALRGSWGWVRRRCGPSSLVGVKTERGEDGSPAAALLREMGGDGEEEGNSQQRGCTESVCGGRQVGPVGQGGGRSRPDPGRMGAARPMEVCVTSKVCSHWVTLVTVLGQSV